MIEKLCRTCFYSFRQYNRANLLCPKCAYNKYAKPRKPIKRIGKVAKKWIETRNKWIKNNPGPWQCYLKLSPMCLKSLSVDTLTLDHIQPRSRRPDLRFEYANLGPACLHCNNLKGSRVLT